MKYSRCTIRGHNYYKVQITKPDGKRKILYGKSIAELREKEVAFREEMKKLPGKNTYTVAQYAALQLSYFSPTSNEVHILDMRKKSVCTSPHRL